MGGLYKTMPPPPESKEEIGTGGGGGGREHFLQLGCPDSVDTVEAQTVLADFELLGMWMIDSS